MVKVTALDTPDASEIKRFGFMAGQIKLPDNFNTMGTGEIVSLLDGKA